MLINFSNHPYGEWSEPQKEAAVRYGEVIDMPFPAVPPDADEAEIERLADDYMARLTAISGDITIHIMGEQTLCFTLIARLLKLHIPCIASCSVRDVTMAPDGTKQVRFHFTRFREYRL